jgi:hypothetical protein
MDKFFINPNYLLKHTLYSAAEHFAKDGSIQLHQFLIPAMAEKVRAAVSRASLVQEYAPDRYSFHEPKSVPIGKQLQNVLKATHEIKDIISTIVQKQVKYQDSCWRVYQHKDYTLLHDKNKEQPGYDVIIDLTPDWDNRACGYHSYVDGNGTELVRVQPAMNALTIVKRDKNTMRFVKYVNHRAGNGRRIVLQARFA